MKKLLVILFTLLILLTGCTQQEATPKPEDNNQPDIINGDGNTSEPDIDYSMYDYFTVEINPAIKIWYDENRKVVAYDYLNADAEAAWSELSLVGLDTVDCCESLILKAGEKGFIKEDATEIAISFSNLTDELLELLNTRLKTLCETYPQLSIVIYNETEGNKSVASVVKHEDKMPMGVWVTYDRVSDGYWGYEASTIVFNEDHRGYTVSHQSYGGFCIALVFDWTDDGTISVHQRSSYSGVSKSEFWFKYEDGVVKSDLPIYGGGETHTFEHSDSFEYVCVPNDQMPPYRNPKPTYSSFDSDYGEIVSALTRN